MADAPAPAGHRRARRGRETRVCPWRAQAGDTGHVMNLGHGIEATTPEPSAALFVDTVHAYKHK